MKKLIAEIKNDNVTLIEINDVLSVNFGALDRGNVTDTTNWSVFSNKGEIVFIDKTKNFRSVISSYEDLSVCIYYHSYQTKKQLATFLIDDYDYNDESKKVTLTLKDKLIGWQGQELEEYLKYTGTQMSQIWNDNYGFISRVSDTALMQMSESYVFPIAYMQKSSKWNNADKICQATMTRCFCDTDGTPLFADETPKQLNNIVIKPRNILSIDNSVGNRKTKIKNASISAKITTLHRDEPISSETPFTVFSISGTKEIDNVKYLIGDQYWNNTNVVVAYSGQDPTKIYVTAYIDKNYKFIRSFYEEITVTIGIAYDSGVDKFKATTNDCKITELGYSKYLPNVVSVEEAGNNKIKVYFEDDTAAEGYPSGEVELDYTENIIGTQCVIDGYITVLGEFFTEDGETVFGIKSENVTKLQGNELIQEANLIYIGEKETKRLAQHIIDTVKAKYGNGVECVELEVTPSEYYDDYGINIINSQGNKPLFEKYDIVTPYVIRNGFEQPYSTKEDGSPKSFKIIGIEYSYQGLLRQKLYLQETTNND